MPDKDPKVPGTNVPGEAKDDKFESGLGGLTDKSLDEVAGGDGDYWDDSTPSSGDSGWSVTPG